ncbi:4Fe-4S dicluster domain-containing protein [Thermodesulfobacteriota bacterium]
MLTNLLFEKVKIESETAGVYEQKSCLRSRFNKNDCRVCLNECRAGALELNGRTISYDAEKCTGCMRCMAVCPNDAFTADIDMLQLLKNIQNQKQVVLSCRNKEQFVPHERIQCIGALSEPLLASMNSLAKGKIFLDVTQCNSCSNAHCLESIKNSLRALRANETEADSTFKVKLVVDEDQFPEVDAKQSRRFFLKGTGKAIADFGIETCIKAIQINNKEIEKPGKGPVKNSLFLQFAIDSTTDVEERKNLKPFFYTIQADELCNLCPVCSGMCPTGALKRVTENGKKHLVFKSSDCSGCGLCRDFCKKQALSISQGFTGDTREAIQIN